MIASSGPPIMFKGFDADFKVEATALETPNKCDISLYNLPSDYRAAFKRGTKQVTLTAGYLNTNVSLIGTYDVQRAWSQLDGTEWVTHIQCSEGLAAWRDAQVNTSFPPGVGRATVYKQVALALTEFGVGVGNLNATMGAVGTKFSNGACLAGNAVDILTRYAKAEGFNFSVQDGQLQFLTDLQTTKLITLSPDTGLIGLPEFSDADPKSKKKPQIKCRSLLRPEARPGNEVVIELPPGEGFISGKVRVNKVTHNGSSYAQSFYTDFECEAVT